jgi:hypothetical protein
MTDPPSLYVTVTVARDGDDLPDPAAFAVAAERIASSRNAVSAQTADQIISAVTVETADQPAAVAVALAIVSGAPRSQAARMGT